MSDDVERAGRVALRTGRVIGAVFCLIFLAAGLSFGWRIALDTWENGQTYLWKPTPCRILKAEVVTRGAHHKDGYSLAVRYEYDWAGQVLVSGNFSIPPKIFKDEAIAQARLAKFRPGQSAHCLVNPRQPQQAILEKHGLWSGLFLAVPLLFVVLGAAGFYGAVFGTSEPSNSSGGQGEAEGPISAGKGRTKPAAGCLALFFFVFFAMGAVTVYVTFLRPLNHVQSAKHWVQVPCQVISSEVLGHRGSKGSVTYSVSILYEYEVAGQAHRSGRYSFAVGSSSGRAGKQAVVDRYPPGSRATCYVNPADPNDAVLERGLVPEVWFGLIPLVFVVVGLGGMGLVLRKRKARPPGSFVADSTRGAVPFGQTVHPGAGEMVLRASGPRAGKFVAMLVFAGIWNGIVSVFVYHVLEGVQHGNVDWFLGIFLLPFVAVGVLTLGLAGYFFLGMFAPRAVLKLGSGTLTLGGSTELTWMFEGRFRSIERLSIVVTGREEITYRRGNKTNRERSQFAEIEVATVTAGDEIRAGRAILKIPADAMHSFTARNSRVIWTLRLRGVIPWYPDVDDEFVLTVLPADAARQKEAA